MECLFQTGRYPVTFLTWTSRNFIISVVSSLITLEFFCLSKESQSTLALTYRWWKKIFIIRFCTAVCNLNGFCMDNIWHINETLTLLAIDVWLKDFNLFHLIHKPVHMWLSLMNTFNFFNLITKATAFLLQILCKWL